MTIQQRITEIAKKATGPALKRGYLAEEYDGIGSNVAIKLSTGSSSAALASVAAGAFGTEQTVPAGTVVTVIEYQGKLEVVSLGSKLSATAVTSEMLSPELQIRDTSGQSVITPDGFAGAWAELIATGVYNGDFSDGIVGDIPAGKTANLPYWNVLIGGTPSLQLVADASYPSGHKLQVSFSAVTDVVHLYGDPITVIGGRAYDILAVISGVQAGGFMDFTLGMIPYTADGSPLQELPWHLGGQVTATPTLIPGLGSNDLPMEASWVVPHIKFAETSHNAGNIAEIGSITVLPVPSSIDVRQDYAASRLDVEQLYISSIGVAAHFHGSGSITLSGSVTSVLTTSPANWNPSATDATAIYIDANGAARNIHSLVNGDLAEGVTKLLVNITSGYDVTLMHLSASPSDLTTRFACPGNADFVLRRRGSVWVRHTGNVWYVIAT